MVHLIRLLMALIVLCTGKKGYPRMLPSQCYGSVSKQMPKFVSTQKTPTDTSNTTFLHHDYVTESITAWYLSKIDVKTWEK